MKILYFCPEYYSNHGGRTHARGFFGALKSLPGVSHCFLYPDSDPQDQIQHMSNQKTSKGRFWFLPPTVRGLYRFFRPRPELTRSLINKLKNHQCDALVIRAGSNRPSLKRIKQACPDTIICLEINSAVFDESYPRLPMRSLFQKLEVVRFKQADAITVVSSYLKDYLEKRGVQSKKIIVNHNGVNIQALENAALQSVREEYGIPEKSFLIGYIGGMETFRRLPEVVAYITELRRAGHDDIYFLIVGDGKDMPNVQASIEANRSVLRDVVKCVGWQEHSEIPRFLEAFDVAIFPFTNEYCSPLKLFEYLGAGVATIGPDTSAVKEVFRDGVHLKMVKQDGSDLINAILDLKGNPQLRKKLGHIGRELVLNEFTWKNNAERVVKHIQRMRG